MAALPLTGLALRALPDRGYALSKVAGWALASWIAWVVAATGLVGRSSTLDSYAVLAVAGASFLTLLWHKGGYMRAWVLYFRERWAYVLLIEAAFVGAFLGFVLLRSYMPEVSGTEKPMELMYLQSLYSSSSLPPDDLWLSGRPANYYYYGYYMNAFVGRMSGAPPAVAFNLSLAGVWASTLVALGGVAYNGVIAGNGRRLRAVAAAALAPALVLIASNPAGALAAWNGIRRPLAEPLSWWAPSRVVYDLIPGRAGPQETINEFPAFSFLLGDLHPHVMAMPLFALGLGVALAIALSAGRPRSHLAGATLFAGAVIGWLWMTNPWDVPVLAAVTALAAWTAARPTDRAVGRRRSLFAPTRLRLRLAVLLPVAAAAVTLPYLLSYNAPVKQLAQLPTWVERLPILSRLGRTVGIVWWDHTEIHELTLVWGFHLALVVAIIVVHRRAVWNARRLLLGAFVVGVAVSLLVQAPVLMLLPVVVSALYVALGPSAIQATIPDPEPSRTPSAAPAFAAHNDHVAATGGMGSVDTAAPLPVFTPKPVATYAPARTALPTADAVQKWGFLLIAAGLGLVMLSELIYLRDLFESRMNTVFKFYFQAWQLLGVACAVLLLVGPNGLDTRRGRMRLLPGLLGAPVVLLLVAAAGLYAMEGVRDRTTGGRQGLDGAAFLTRQDESAALAAQWLLENTSPGTVVLEATGGPYSSYARIATFSGRPTVLGWANHERQWRAGRQDALREIEVRGDDVRTLYSPLTAERRRELFDKYDVRYVYYGELEREMQREDDVPESDPFAGLLPVAATFGESVLYRVP